MNLHLQNRRSAVDALDTISRAAAYFSRDPNNALTLAKAEYPDDWHLHESLRTKAASVPASSANITAFDQTAVSDLGSVLGPMTGFTQVSVRALGLSRGRSASIAVPYGLGAADAVKFTQQGMPISVKQMNFTSATLSGQESRRYCRNHPRTGRTR